MSACEMAGQLLQHGAMATIERTDYMACASNMARLLAVQGLAF